MLNLNQLFTEAEQQLILESALAVWDHIGWDCLRAKATEQRKAVDRVSYSRNEVVDIVLDAGRLREELETGYGATDAEKALVTPDFLKRWEDMRYEHKTALLKKAFTDTRYST